MNDEWWVHEREPGETPFAEAWHKRPGNIFGMILVGVVAIVWLTW